LQGLSWSGVPMHLRLFVDAGGTVVDVAVLQAYDDARVVERVRRMFLSTAFTPGRVGGVDVDSYRDIELNVADRAG
jgi:N-methylhydantoinase A/oxoprolinase/acetone carboxylase beta subunit